MARRLMTASELAELLGVDRRQVDMWDKRGDRNGFPRSCGTEERRAGKPQRVWDPVVVRVWHKRYQPSKGGRPRNAVRQGSS